MKTCDSFNPTDFLPYLLNLAAEETSLDFQSQYKDRYGLLRTEWRVLFHLGGYGEMTAKNICERARLHKTKVSRAVAKLQARRFLKRIQLETDRRQEMLILTRAGRLAYEELRTAAIAFDRELSSQLTRAEDAALRKALVKLSNIQNSTG